MAIFVPNLVAMATAVGLGKNAIDSIQGPIPDNTPYRRKQYRSLRMRKQMNFSSFLMSQAKRRFLT